MPHISVAMRMSLRRSVGDIVVGSLLRRDTIQQAQGEVNSVKNSFSSWDNCMQAVYCKWPVIGAIILVSLIVFSILWCIIRCACCGMSCCCTCFSFLSCCDCCGGSCDGKKNKPMKHRDDTFGPTPSANQGYQAPAPMPSAFASGGLASKPPPPQYARFDDDSGKNKVHELSEDALPEMPSWDTASKRQVLVEEEEVKEGVELGELDPATGQKVPLVPGAAPPGGRSGPPTPSAERVASPFGRRPPPGPNPNGYMAVPNDPYGRPQNNMSPNGMGPNGRGYGGPQFQPGMPRRGEYGQGPHNGQGFNGNGPAELESPPGQAMSFPMNNGRPLDPPSPQDYNGHDYHDNEFEQGAGGGYPPQRGNQPYPDDPNGRRPFPPQPQRQFSDGSRSLTGGRQYSDRPYDQNRGPYGSDQQFPNNGPGPMPPQNRGSPGPNRGPGPGRTPSPITPTNNLGFEFVDGAPSRPLPQRSPPPQQPLPYPPPGRGPSPGSQPPYGGPQGRSPPPNHGPYGPGPRQGGPQTRSPPPGQAPYNDGRRGPQDGGRPDYSGSRSPPMNNARSPPPGNNGPGYVPYSRPQGPPGSSQSGREPPQSWDPTHR